MQIILADAGRWVAAFHPTNAFLLLGLVGYLSNALWRGGAASEEMTPAGAL